jgi:hypothetical protein
MIIWHAYIIFTFGRFLSKLVVCHDVWDASVNIYLFHGWVNPEMGPLILNTFDRSHKNPW